MKENIIQFPGVGPGRPRKYKIKGAPKGPAYEPDAGWNPLSNRQKGILAQLAKTAARRQYLPETGPEHDAWRQETSLRLAKTRIRDARQKDWETLHAIWLDLAGDSGAAFTSLLRSADNKRRVAAYKLDQLLKALGLRRGYAETILRSKYKTTWAEAPAKSIWKVFFELKSRANAKP